MYLLKTLGRKLASAGEALLDAFEKRHARGAEVQVAALVSVCVLLIVLLVYYLV